MRMSQDAIERDRYESRLKHRRDMQQFERDRQTSVANLAVAEASLATTQASLAATQARAAEAFVGQIHLCQRLLKQPLTPKEELVPKSLDELQTLADELQRQALTGK